MESKKERPGDLEPVLITGEGRMACSVSVCLSAAGHTVTLHTSDGERSLRRIGEHFSDWAAAEPARKPRGKVSTTGMLEDLGEYSLVVALTEESLEEKRSLIGKLEEKCAPEAVIAITAESISLDALQEHSRFPERIVGVNWVEPAHTTFFLELITNRLTDPAVPARVAALGREHWQKNPYVLAGGTGIRSRLFSAMAREAFYLVQNGYASVEDIDRACRNDAGYYLPFAGNCRYMDLMGTYAYGMVMAELNPDLARDTDIAPFFRELLAGGATGMESGRGFYVYGPGDREKWDALCRAFSYRIRQIMEKYPFNYRKGKPYPEKTGDRHED
jgi:3-hydroxybutyryl-CoA dehydrogenase